MRSLLIKLLIIIVPVGLTIAATNYQVDPANIFSGVQYADGIANMLARGHNVDNLSNYDERLLQEQMIKRLHKAPDVVVLGSSRVMEIGSSFFPGKKVLNCGVSHGNINDLFGIVGALDSLDRLPREVIIGVEHGLICIGGTSEWQSLYPYHESLITKLFGTSRHPDGSQLPNRFQKESSLFSFDYFESSLQFLLERKSKRYADVGLNKPTTYGRFSDGSICYSEKYTNPDESKVAIDAKVTASEKGLPAPDSSKARLLEGLLKFLQDKKINVHLIMVPYHPEFYKTFLQYYPQTAEEWRPIFKDIADKFQLPLSGSFDADSVGMPKTVFYDMYHCSGESIKKYIPIL